VRRLLSSLLWLKPLSALSTLSALSALLLLLLLLLLLPSVPMLILNLDCRQLWRLLRELNCTMPHEPEGGSPMAPRMRRSDALRKAGGTVCTLSPMFWSNDGMGPKSGCDCRMEFSRSSASISCALHIASP